MRKSLWIFLLVVVLLNLARVYGGSESPTAAAQELPREPVQLTVLTRSGAETILTIDDDTEVLVVATWCPYTRRLDSLLKDSRAREYLGDKRLVYLVAFDELDRRAEEGVREGRMSQAAADAYVHSQPRGPRLIDRDFLANTAAEQIYFYDAEHPVRNDAYPAAFSGPPNEFMTDHGVWMSRRLGMPQEVKDRLFAAYPL